MTLLNKYDRFVGQTVSVVETVQEYKGKQYKEYDVSPDDTVIAEIKAEAALGKLSVRVWLPDTIGTMDLRNDRINVHIDKQEDGNYKITSLNIG
jgi:hypothetical protein